MLATSPLGAVPQAALNQQRDLFAAVEALKTTWPATQTEYAPKDAKTIADVTAALLQTFGQLVGDAAQADEVPPEMRAIGREVLADIAVFAEPLGAIASAASVATEKQRVAAPGLRQVVLDAITRVAKGWIELGPIYDKAPSWIDARDGAVLVAQAAVIVDAARGQQIPNKKVAVGMLLGVGVLGLGGALAAAIMKSRREDRWMKGAKRRPPGVRLPVRGAGRGVHMLMPEDALDIEAEEVEAGTDAGGGFELPHAGG